PGATDSSDGETPYPPRYRARLVPAPRSAESEAGCAIARAASSPCQTETLWVHPLRIVGAVPVPIPGERILQRPAGDVPASYPAPIALDPHRWEGNEPRRRRPESGAAHDVPGWFPEAPLPDCPDTDQVIPSRSPGAAATRDPWSHGRSVRHGRHEAALPILRP